jgi:hypothetical protein
MCDPGGMPERIDIEEPPAVRFPTGARLGRATRAC